MSKNRVEADAGRGYIWRMDTITTPQLIENTAGMEADLMTKGFTHIAKVLSEEQCAEIRSWYGQAGRFRTTINMARYRFGEGEYKYFTYPLPELLQKLRSELYEALVPAANAWARALQLPVNFPNRHADFISHCHAHGQKRPTPLLLTYGEGGHNTLHQDLYGAVYFPFQPVFFLSQPGWDYQGGEFVLVEQRPRAQSRAWSLSPGLGDLIVFATSQRPVQGSKGYYRVQMRHGVSTVHSGHRMTLGIPLHDAT